MEFCEQDHKRNGSSITGEVSSLTITIRGIPISTSSLFAGGEAQTADNFSVNALNPTGVLVGLLKGKLATVLGLVVDLLVCWFVLLMASCISCFGRFCWWDGFVGL